MNLTSASMWNFQTLKKVTSVFRAKKYLGVMFGNLPSKPANWGGEQFLSALDISLYTDRAIDKRATKVSEIEFELKDHNDNVIERDPLLDLLYRPNKVFVGREFWKLYQIYYDTVGEVYIWVEAEENYSVGKKVKGLHLLIPTKVKPIVNEMGIITGYEYKTKEKTEQYTLEEIIYIHNPDPKNPLRGRSLLRSGVPAIQTEAQIAEYHSRVLENGGKVEGVFTFKTGPLTEEQLEQTKDRYQKEYGAAKKAGLPLFLGGDASYIKTGLSPEELSFLEAKKMTLEDICILTGVPKSMLASTNDVKFDNADADRAIFLRETIVPLLKVLTTALDEKLFPDERTLSFVDPTPENVDQKLKETESGVKSFYMTINEARERHGLDPISNGDEILVPFNMVPLGDVTFNTDAAAKQLIIAKMKKEAGMQTKMEHPLRDPELRETYAKIQVKRMDQREKGFKRAVVSYFDEQEAKLISLLEPEKTRVFRKKELLDELLQVELEVSAGMDKFTPLLRELILTAGGDAMELAGSDYAFTLSAHVVDWLTDRTEVFLRSVNETTFAKLRAEFAASLEAEEGREELIKRIQETYGGIKKSRAGLIARTEVHNATQYGTLEGYKQAGLNIKIWVAVRDGHTRDSHAAVDGEERPIDAAFSNGLMYPGDPNAPAEETINCRCVI